MGGSAALLHYGLRQEGGGLKVLAEDNLENQVRLVILGQGLGPLAVVRTLQLQISQGSKGITLDPFEVIFQLRLAVGVEVAGGQWKGLGIDSYGPRFGDRGTRRLCFTLLNSVNVKPS